jgi:hypothetical protein
MRPLEEIEKDARDVPPFSNGTSGKIWMGGWCDRCLVDAPFRNGINGTGGPVLLVALMGKTPAEWLEVGVQSYTCLEARFPGDDGGLPRPKPEPRGMSGLFPRPEREVRMLTQPSVPSEVADAW